jgi:hypothetical protein
MGLMSRLAVRYVLDPKLKGRERRQEKKRQRQAAKRSEPVPANFPPPAAVPGKGPFAHFTWKAMKAAEYAGFYILVEGAAEDPCWSIFSRATGKWVINYHPKSRRWARSHTDWGTVKGWREVLAMVVSGSRQ